MASFDVLIKNGTLLDGEAAEGRLADIGVSGDEIAAIGSLSSSKAALEIDATGRYVAPGFVDAQNHSDSYFTLLEVPGSPSLVAQGITTIAVGQCGSSLAPLANPEALRSIQKWHSVAGANINWLTFAEYYQQMERYPLGVNLLSMVGHSTVRRGLIGDQARAASPEELKVIERMVYEGLDAGAAGVSLGLVYAHESNASREELLAAAQMAAGQNKLYSVHLRSEGKDVIESLTEAVQLAQEAKARLKISHFKIRGKNNWNKLQEALSIIDRVYQNGVDVFFDVYPYTTSWTVLYTFLPRWAYEGGRKAIIRNLKDRTKRGKILDYLKSQEQDLGSIFIAASETNPSLVGRNLHQVAVNQEVSVEEALLNVVSATETQVLVFDQNISKELMVELLKHPLSVVSTDGAGYDFKFHPLRGLVHPRCFGTMPKFLSMVRDSKLMAWPDAVKKITSTPAKKLGLTDRGILREGYKADITVFNPSAVGSKASYENPYQPPQGIDYVFVNGKLAHSMLEVPGEPSGRLIRL